MSGTQVPEFFDRERLLAGRGSTRRRRPLLLLTESWSGTEPGSEVLDFLSGTEVFGRLDRAALRELFAHLDPVHVAAGEVVLDAGRVPDALHLLAYGRLAVRSARGTREIAPGQVVGAGALLGSDSGADAPTGLQVRAVRDSLVLRLGVAGFERFARAHPASLLGLCRALVRADVPEPAQPAAAAGTTIVLLPAGSGRVPDDVANGLVAALGRVVGAGIGAAVEVSATTVDAALGAGASGTEPADPRNGRLLAWLQRVEAANRFVVYRADDRDTEWTRRCVRQADRVVLVARAGTDPAPGPAEGALAEVGGERRRDLVLLHPAGTEAPSGTAAWLAGRGIARHHHVREPRDLDRVARFLSGTARGLVLAGGGVRGFAHLGVMQAVDEAGIPIDAVGGASIGAIMAGFYAAGLEHEQRLRRARRAMVEQGSMVGFTLPFVAVSSGRKVTRLLREEPSFAGSIEDLWLPYFCVSASLSQAREVVHDSGPTWRAIRSSIAIPGVYPPVHDGTQLLVDGGVMNNLPVDVMSAVVDDGPIVAVNLQPTGSGRRPPAEFDLAVSGWRVLGSRLNPFIPRMRVPRLGDVLLRSMSLSTARLQRDRLGSRSVELLTPPVGRSGMLDFQAGPSLVEPAYRYAVEALARSRTPV